MKKLITKGDIFLLALFLASVLLIICIPILRSSGAESADTASGPMVEICVDGEEYASCPLNEDQTITVTTEYGTNVIVIEGGSVCVTESDCSNQVCVYTGAISSTGRMIVCLPHLLSVEIVSETEMEGALDAVSQ